MIESRYQPSEVEPRIYVAWEDTGAFRAGRPERAKAEPYCIVIPPPNVTGSLHMGHALNNTLQDILCRFERMRGKDVLWQLGMDHAGIATQAVVERQLMERQQPSSREMGRETFIKRVWEWKAESGGTIISQLKRLGASCDWSRERFTMDEGLSRAVLKVFVALYREGLIYKDKRLVNWDPKLKTAISDLEVQQVESKGQLWHIKYPIEDSGEFIVVATTRPETMLGDVAVAVHPHNQRLNHLIGKIAILPLVGRRIPVIADDYADPEKGSGAVKITPAHDFNDFEVGRRHGRPLINIFDAEATLKLRGNSDFLAHLQGVGETNETDELVNWTIETLDGLDRFAARKKVVGRLEEKGLIEKIEPTTHVVPHGDRSGAVLEPYLTDQWYVDAKTLAQPAMLAVRERKTVFIPPQWEATFFNWMENIQPWCISRQIWWGHQIPAWYGPKLEGEKEASLDEFEIFVAESAETAVALAERHYGRPVKILSSKPSDDHELMNLADAAFNGAPFPIWRDEDVLDTWFSSALWPFSTLGWPDQTPELKRFYPTSTLVTGFDIIFFWVARMMMMGLHFMQKGRPNEPDRWVPFRDVYIHALVRDERGQKMSKSKGNVIDPLAVIDEYGADALRFTLAAMAAQGRDIKLSEQRVEGYRNFATKLWNAARFAEINGCARDPAFDPRRAVQKPNRWIIHETTKVTKEIGAALENYRFNDAAGAIYRFVWNLYCDWYLEFIKPLLTGSDVAAKAETRAVTAWTLDQILKLLHPFMPFVTEELWRVTREWRPAPYKLLALESWPQLVDLENEMAPSEPSMDVALDVVTETRAIRTIYNVPWKEPLSINLASFGDSNTSVLASTAQSIARLANTSIQINGSDLINAVQTPAGMQYVFSATQPSAGTSISSTSLNLGSASTPITIQTPVKDGLLTVRMPSSLDPAIESARLQKEITTYDSDIARVDQKLANPNFVTRAPEEVVEEERRKRDEAEAKKTKIVEALRLLTEQVSRLPVVTELVSPAPEERPPEEEKERSRSLSPVSLAKAKRKAGLRSRTKPKPKPRTKARAKFRTKAKRRAKPKGRTSTSRQARRKLSAKTKKSAGKRGHGRNRRSVVAARRRPLR
jgi:valyl-tRNA synthetase